MRKLLPSSLLTVSLLSLAACGDPPTPTQVRSRITTDLGYVLAQANAAAQGAALPSTTALSVLSHLVPTTGTSASASAVKHLTAWLPSHTVGKRAKLTAGSNDAIDAQAAIDFLDDTVFTDANYLGNGIYQVPASIACNETSIDSSGTETTTLNADCAAKFAQADVRVRVEEDGDALRFAVQLDANHDEPVALSLAHDAVGLTIDLDGADKAMIALASIYAETPPNLRLSGQVTAELKILGTAHARASFTIDRDVAIAFADHGESLDGSQAFKLASAQAEVFALELDGGAHTGVADLGLGATTAQIPHTASDPIALDVPGATAHATFASDGPLTITGIGLGDRQLTLSRGGRLAIGIDLDKDTGRKLDATLATDGTLSVSPALDVRIAIDHAVLGDEPGPFDVTQVLMTGAVRPRGDGLEVVTGTFAVVTSPASFGVVASAGQCVTQTEVSDPSGTFYEQWLAASCH